MAIEKYFLFSATQLRFRQDAELKLGRRFKPGQVIVKGKKHPFTEISSKPASEGRYSDFREVYHGDPTKVKYTMPTAE